MLPTACCADALLGFGELGYDLTISFAAGLNPLCPVVEEVGSDYRVILSQVAAQGSPFTLYRAGKNIDHEDEASHLSRVPCTGAAATADKAVECPCPLMQRARGWFVVDCRLIVIPYVP